MSGAGLPEPLMGITILNIETQPHSQIITLTFPHRDAPWFKQEDPSDRGHSFCKNSMDHG